MLEAHRQDNWGYTDRDTYFEWHATAFKEVDAIQTKADFLAGFGGCFLPDPTTRDLVERIAVSYPVACLTNGSSDNQRNKLDHAGLAALFGERVVVSQEVGAWKPDARVFHACEQLLNLPRSELLYVGDNFDHDYLGAATAGWQSCWLRLGRPARDGVLSIDTLSELPEILGMEMS